tara:strand:- start:718 stop:1803 length:1086 start_codon:yes stop_codon:yes gene_type:complete
VKNYLHKYKNKKILITGHTGFKGSWLTSWLAHLGANIIGVSNSIPTKPSNYEASNIKSMLQIEYKYDITDKEKIAQIIKDHKPDFVFHLAAQSLVRESYLNPIKTFSTNVIGSINILDSLKNIDKQMSVIMITSDKVYRNYESNKPFSENDVLGGDDPYSASKGMAEIAIRSYYESYFKNNKNIRLGIGRAGNVIGGGDWASDRIIPDVIKSWQKKTDLTVRSPNSIRPWQHVIEPLSGYLKLGLKIDENLEINGEAYNFGPENRSQYKVKDVLNLISKHLNNFKWSESTGSYEKFHEAKLLTLDHNKAYEHLDWSPLLSFYDSVKLTCEWYKMYYSDDYSDMNDLNIKQINEYEKLGAKS